MENIIKFDLSKMGSLDIQSMHKVIDAYRFIDEPIVETGFNIMSGYVYIYLESGISICSNFGQSVDYLVTDFETGEEHFFDTYDEAFYALETTNL